jgi:membrane-associated phospholipid phosphatase
MKKSVMSYPILWMVFPIIIAIIGIIIGSFTDFQLSSSFANVNNGFGRFMETFGLGLAISIIMLGGTLIWKGLYKNEKVLWKVIAWIALVIALGATIYFAMDNIGLSSKAGLDQDYGIRLNKIVAALVGAIFAGGIFCLVFFCVRDDNPMLLVKIGLIIFLAVFLQWLFIHFIKMGAGRPRYRFLIDDTLNTNHETFRNFWEWKSGFKDDSHKSWPSGHSATAAIMILLPLLHPVFKKQVKHGSLYLYLGGFAYYVIMAYSRVRVGAHFLSDVSWGGLFGFLLSFLSLFLAEGCFKMLKIDTNKTEENKVEEVAE